MKLSAFASSDYVKLLVYGVSGSGKTCLASSFPGPIEYWDFDHKISSAAKFHSGNPALLEGIEVTQFAHLDKTKRIPAWEERSRYVDSFRGKPLPFKTLVLDSLTTFSQMLIDDYIYRSQTGLKRPLPEIPCMQDYQLLDKHLTRIITGCLSLECNVVFIGHLGSEVDEVTKAISKKPLMAGKFADKLPIWFEEVYVSKVDAQGKFKLQTQGDHQHICRSQRKLPKEIDSSYAAIIGKV